MYESSNNNSRIAKNTLFLYIRSILIMTISVFTSRVVLQALGVEDYGLYNVVGGFVGMFSIISSSLVSASQRFISFEMGKTNPEQNKVFCSIVSIHIFLVFVLIVLFETFGLWFLNTKLNITSERIVAANWVYQCSIITFCVNLLSVPYNATIIAHEKMNAFAYISIFEVIAKLGIAYLICFSHSDKLIFYAILMPLIAVIIRLIYSIYCRRNFEECRFRIMINKSFVNSLLSFIGWNFIGSTAGVLVTQGVNVLINLFFGVALNAARGIAEQANNAINQFVTNFMTAMNPQITKSYASSNYEYMNSLMEKGAKYAAILLWFLSLPVFAEAEFILNLWLVEVPPYAPLFLRLAIIFSVFQSLSNTLYIGMLATGHIKKYQIIMGIIYISSFVLCYFLFTIGFGPEWGYISTIIALLIGAIARLLLLKEIINGFSIKSFIKNTIIKSLSLIFITSAIIFTIKHFLPNESLISSISIICLSVLLVPLVTYSLAIDENERRFLSKQLKKYFHRNK